jgi:hypothetical protein
VALSDNGPSGFSHRELNPDSERPIRKLDCVTEIRSVPLPSSGEKESSRPTLHTRVYSDTLGLASFKCAVLLRAGSMYKNAQSSSSPTQEITRRRSRFRSGTLSQVPKRCSRPCISTSTPLLRGHQTKLDSYRPLLTGTMEKKPTDSPRWLPKSNPGQQFTQDPKNVTAGSTPPLCLEL